MLCIKKYVGLFTFFNKMSLLFRSVKENSQGIPKKKRVERNLEIKNHRKTMLGFSNTCQRAGTPFKRQRSGNKNYKELIGLCSLVADFLICLIIGSPKPPSSCELHGSFKRFLTTTKAGHESGN